MQRIVISMVMLSCLAGGAWAQKAGESRMASGVPDFQGIWQAMNTANYNLEAHIASQGPTDQLGAIGAVPPGASVVVGGTIPYLPEALAQRASNFDARRTEDPEAKCYMPGIPRGTYLGQPFQIFQTDSDIMMVYQFAGAVRTVYMDNHMEAPIDSWMGWSNGHWDGDTLVIEVTGLNPNWLDRAGNYYTATATITERYTLMGPNHLNYQATIEDPAVYSQPWTIEMPLYRRVEENARLFDFKCPEFTEEILYSHLSRENYLRDHGFPMDADAENAGE